jgi:hypothetical protein
MGSSWAASLTEGTVLPNYALVALGSGKTLGINSGPLTGNVLVGNGITIAASGGGNGKITGSVDESGTVLNSSTWSQLQTPPSVNVVPSSVATQALSDAQTLSTTAAGLQQTSNTGYATGTGGKITITGNGGLNVVDFSTLQNPLLTIVGNSSDFFVFNVSGSLNTNEVMTLNGVTASQILWNFTGTSGNVFQTSGGDLSYGTFLATNGGNFQFSNLNLTGQLINTAGDVQFVSGSSMSGQPATPPSVPEPSSTALLASGSLALIGLIRWSRSKQNESARLTRSTSK